jgi:hypothetical protein
MNFIPFFWQEYNNSAYTYFATDGFDWRLRYQTILEAELPTNLCRHYVIRSVRFTIGFNRFHILNFETPVNPTLCFLRVLNYFNEYTGNGRRRGDLFQQDYAYVYSFYMEPNGRAVLLITTNAISPIITVSDSESD